MAKRIIYARPDGGVSVVVPIEGSRRAEETEEAWLDRIRIKAIPAGANAEIVDDTSIPSDRTFRDAWVKTAGSVTHDMAKARNLMRMMLRSERAERFRSLDGLWMRAMGRGETAIAAEVESRREVLRNWPQDPRIATVDSPDALKVLIAAMKSEVSP